MTTDKETRLERRSDRRLLVMPRVVTTHTRGRWESVLLVGIDWADKEHVYCLMDDAGTTLATGTVEHTAEGLERFMNAVRARVQTPHDILIALETSHGPLVGACSTEGLPSMLSIRRRWSVIGTGSALPAPNPICGMPGCWPRSCGRIVHCIIP